MNKPSPEISVVITLLNERENIKPLLENLRSSLDKSDYEIILVDDGSTDGTVREIKHYADEKIKLVRLQKNYGQSLAMAAGIAQAKGMYTVTMDGDLQNDPADIPHLLSKIQEEDVDLVAGNRRNRKDGFILRKFPSWIANALIRKLSGVYISDYGCSMKIFNTELAKELGLYGELHRFIPILAQLQGAKITQMDVNHRPRIYGKSKYGLGRTFKVMSDLMLLIFFQKYVLKPMHLFGTIGLLSLMVGIAINTYLFIEKLMGQDIWGRPLLMLGTIFLLGGIQLITFGFLAELLMRTYFESQNKTPFKVREVYVGRKVEEMDKVY
jgi:glycosyltransferase involved in cell wall biosynthesis